MGHHHVRVEISADRPEIGRIIWPDPRKTSKLFSKKKVNICSSSFRRTPKNRVFAPRAQNHPCGQSVAFVAFVAFWGTTMLFFQKYDISAFICTKNYQKIFKTRECSSIGANIYICAKSGEKKFLL